ncbi:hypothetical protein TSUD_376270 [Trifolium subterraneum]|uniref:Uncharacterized protein n=1 Tax=Trifolium subterraneum TaxID=3900 RepID=A0A2Z6M449_TRISU|nr:hypothetical protein TSUD_376270 [Trifolium subterraneum]
MRYQKQAIIWRDETVAAVVRNMRRVVVGISGGRSRLRCRIGRLSKLSVVLDSAAVEIECGGRILPWLCGGCLGQW